MDPLAVEEEIRKLTTLLDVPVAAAAERIQRLHEELGISYFSFSKTPGTSWDTFGKLITALRWPTHPRAQKESTAHESPGLKLEGDELHLGTASPIRSSGKTVNSVLVWRRAEPN